MSKIKAAINHPWTAARVLKTKMLRPFIEEPDEKVNIIEKDWDNLIILDACRFDTFQKCNHIEGDLSKIHSTASQTSEFLRRNITDTHSDVVYISASPQLVGYEENFHRIEHLWQEYWDDDLKTVTPWAVTKQAKRIAESYPDKRLIVHYMQPHYPFIGNKSNNIGDHATFGETVENKDKETVWDLLASGKVDIDSVKAAYEENLKIALDDVEELVSTIEGKTVISSDHGNLFNKKTTFLPINISGHPSNFHDSELLAVPWLELSHECRKQTSDGSVSEQYADSDMKNVENKLQDLGYL